MKPDSPLNVARTIAIALIILAVPGVRQLSGDSQPPNIIFILADDLGYGDIGCNGQSHFETPCLDRMAREGMVFNQFYAGSTVCAPSRACLLTGQHTGHVYQRFNGPVQFREDDNDITVARMLKTAGYATAMIGKSGLSGRSDDPLLPFRKGFDHFYGFISHRAAHRYYPETLWDNDRKVTFENNRGKSGDTYSGKMFLEQSLSWIDKNRQGPFFLHVSLQQPHADLAVPDEFRNPHINRFDEQPHPAGKHYRAETHPRATYAGMVQYLDHSVGQILDKLVELGIEKQTYVFFSSDNGPHFEGGAHPDHFDSNGPLRGGKRDLYEGGIRVPLLVWAPGKVAAGSRSDHISAFWDFPATACELASVADADPGDGISLVPTLHGTGNQASHEYLYWEFYEQNGKQAVRMGDWKAIRLNVNRDRHGPLQLFNLKEDIGESRDLATAHPERVRKMAQLMEAAHTPHPDKKFGTGRKRTGRDGKDKR